MRSVKQRLITSSTSASGLFERTELTSSAFLSGLIKRQESYDVSSVRKSVYTGMRVVSHHRIFQYPKHMLRFVNASAALSNADVVRSRLTPLVSSILSEYNTINCHSMSDNSSSDETSKVTVFYDPLNDVFHVHIGELDGSMIDRPVRAVIRLGKREQGLIKSADWIVERQKYMSESDHRNKFNDVILCEPPNGLITEGLNSNVCVLKMNESEDGDVLSSSLITTPISEAAILNGTVRSFMMEQGMLEERSLLIEECSKWTGAFLMSTSRLCLPIEQLVFDVSEPETTELAKLVSKETMMYLKRNNFILDFSQNSCLIDSKAKSTICEIESKVRKLVSDASEVIVDPPPSSLHSSHSKL